MRLRRTALFVLVLVIGLIGACILWLRAQQRQYTLNRALIAALVKGDDKQALALVNAGADPNTRYKPTPVPSLPELVKQLLHRSPSPVNNSETALSIACGGVWDDEPATFDAQQHRPDSAPLVQAMLRHGATVNVKDNYGRSPLIWAACFNRQNTMRLLLHRRADVNAVDSFGETPLVCAIAWQRWAMVGTLLEGGANANIQDEFGYMALHWAL